MIAIDGPSASGKSSTAGAVAEQLGLAHLDSGALYRGMTRIALDRSGSVGVESVLGAPERLIQEAERRKLTLTSTPAGFVPRLDGMDADPLIRTPVVTAGVSAVSAVPAIREWVDHQLRAIARSAGGAVVDGRDIGTVVFPEAPLKIYLIASARARARRRLEQRGEAVGEATLAAETARLSARDQADSQRAVAPLRMAADALPLDGTDLTFAEQVAWIVSRARSIGIGQPKKSAP
ncbi:MAG: (d)CMP kinase [Gemmatimonadota bacterium]